MNRFVSIHIPSLGSVPVSRDKAPDICPHCHRTMDAEEIAWFTVEKDTETIGLDAVFRCPAKTCRRLFIAQYDVQRRGLEGLNEGLFSIPFFAFRNTLPTAIAQAAFPVEVEKISPSFVETYAQAEQAEGHSLLQICGLGYRKAIEFLIKDFCGHEHPTQVQRIKEMPLMQCINEFVADVNIKTTAERAVWIGNDEAHYVRKWMNQDIGDMKTLVRLTSNWIDSVLLTRQYKATMQKTVPPARSR